MNTLKSYFALILISLLGLAPVEPAFGAASPPAPSTATNRPETPPVEQALVPEGAFAIQLAEALKMGPVQDEAQAESQLSALGIAPKNGWIAGYPMTPPAMVEIEKGVAAAAESGKLKMRKEEALKAVAELKAKLGLDVSPVGESQLSVGESVPGGRPASTVIYRYVDRNGVIHFTDQYGSIPKEYLDRAEVIRGTVHPSPAGEPTAMEMQPPPQSSIPSPGPEVVNHYYYDYGPPVVTYYAPPPPYYYLYSWVPYPFWWGPRCFFPGFFILHDFHRHVGFHGRGFVCTNHVVAHNRWYWVHPVTRGLQDGRMAGRISSPQVFNSQRVQSSARTIAGQSRGPHAWTSPPPQPRTPSAPPTPSVARFQGPPRPTTQQRVTTGPVGNPGNHSGGPSSSPGRTFRQPPSGGNLSAPSLPRAASHAPASVLHGPGYPAPAPSGRGSFGGFQSSGGFGSRGNSFWGVSPGGHR